MHGAYDLSRTAAIGYRQQKGALQARSVTTDRRESVGICLLTHAGQSSQTVPGVPLSAAGTLLLLSEIGRRLHASTGGVGMINEDYMHLAEKLSDARRALMLPHLEGETESIVNAFSECSKVLRILPTPDLDDAASDWAETILGLMDTSKFDESAGDGTWDLKASSLSVEDKYELSNAVDELASWAHSKVYGDD